MKYTMIAAALLLSNCMSLPQYQTMHACDSAGYQRGTLAYVECLRAMTPAVGR